ncbi:MAG: enoyl-CoA hydratase/isomerase family protein [Burkholderiales bacterium]|nr:enoyl-CoA hydratase/isomerase family protein [Burkholderiales bacterium]
MAELEHDGLYRLAVADGVAVVTLNRPEVMNAMNMQLRSELIELFPRLDLRADVRVIVLTGAGDRAFCTGADLKERSRLSTADMYRQRRFLQTKTQNLVSSLNKPTIAAINGYCMGGGLEIALQCDLCIAADRAVFALPEATHGFIPGAGGTQRLARAVGVQKAKEIILTGRRFDAREAEAMGVVCKVVAADELMAESMALAARIARNPATAVMQAKLAINASQETGLAAGLLVENESWLSCMLSDEWKEKTEGFARGERKA